MKHSLININFMKILVTCKKDDGTPYWSITLLKISGALLSVFALHRVTNSTSKSKNALNNFSTVSEESCELSPIQWEIFFSQFAVAWDRKKWGL